MGYLLKKNYTIDNYVSATSYLKFSYKLVQALGTSENWKTLNQGSKHRLIPLGTTLTAKIHRIMRLSRNNYPKQSKKWQLYAVLGWNEDCFLPNQLSSQGGAAEKKN